MLVLSVYPAQTINIRRLKHAKSSHIFITASLTPSPPISYNLLNLIIFATTINEQHTHTPRQTIEKQLEIIRFFFLHSTLLPLQK